MMFPTDYAIDPAALAKEVEDRGFDSLWFPEHSHIPTSRESPYPGGGDLPRMYLHTYDPFVALTQHPAATSPRQRRKVRSRPSSSTVIHLHHAGHAWSGGWLDRRHRQSQREAASESPS